METLVVINIATFATVVFYGFKVSRFISRSEFKLDMMWRAYCRDRGIEVE